MNDLVYLKNDEAVCSSLDVAEMFKKKHKNVLQNIDKIVAQNSATEKMFHFSTRVAADNQEHRICYMNRDGFSLLAMGFTGKRALEWKLKYIKAFNTMESILREKTTETWLETRQQGKLTRKAETDVIKQLVEYAKGQGSEHADKLYITYSNLAKKMSGVSNRETATVSQLNNLTLMENIILNCIQNGIIAEKHYKEIYQDCKRRLEMFKDIAYLENKS